MPYNFMLARLAYLQVEMLKVKNEVAFWHGVGKADLSSDMGLGYLH